MKHRAVHRLSVGVASLMVATFAAVGGTALPAAAAGGNPPDPALVLAVAKWVTNGGATDLKALAADFQSLETAANAGDMPSISKSCTQLQADVENAQAYDPIPDPKAQHDWADALAQYARGATDCVAGAGSPSPSADLITKASTEITTGSDDLNKVTARLNQIAG
jgi:hypothetical protein